MSYGTTRESKKSRTKKPEKTDDQRLLEEARKRFKLSADAWADNRRAFVEDVEFGAGKQWPEAMKIDRERKNRPCLVVPRLQSFIRQVTNDQRQNRPSIKVRPVDDYADKETAEIMQGLIRHIEANSNSDLAYDNATQYSVSGGFGFWRITTDYQYGAFEQEIFIKPIYNSLSVYPDHGSMSLDGSDYRYCFIVDERDRDDFEAEYGDDLPTGWDEGDDLESDGWCTQHTVRLAEYYYTEKVKDVLLRFTDGSTMYKSDYEGRELDKEVEDEREEYRQKVCWALLAGNVVLDKKEWAGRFIPVIPVYGDQVIVNGKRVLISLIRLAKDAQRMLNYYRSTEAEIYALQPKAPFIIAEGQAEGYEDEWNNANEENFSRLTYKPTTIGGVAVPPPQRSLPMGLPQGAMQLSEIAERDMMNIIGIHEAGLGMRSNETSGAAIMARQREGDNATYHFIDNVIRAIRFTGQQLVDLIPKIYDTDRVVRILGENGDEETVRINAPVNGGEGEEIGRLYDMSLGQYDVVCAAGPSFTTKRQEAAAAMERLIPAYPQLMQVAGDLVVKAMDWPGADDIADRLVKALPPELRPKQEEGEEEMPSPELQAAQQQIQQMDQAMQAMQAELNSKQVQDQTAIAKTQNEQQKLAIEAEKVAIDKYNAETNRLKVEADIAMQANKDLTESERAQFEADFKAMMDDRDKDHEIEMELLRQRHKTDYVATEVVNDNFSQ